MEVLITAEQPGAQTSVMAKVNLVPSGHQPTMASIWFSAEFTLAPYGCMLRQWPNNGCPADSPSICLSVCVSVSVSLSVGACVCVCVRDNLSVSLYCSLSFALSLSLSHLSIYPSITDIHLDDRRNAICCQTRLWQLWYHRSKPIS